MAKELTPKTLLEAAAGGDVGEVIKLLDVSSADQSEFEENGAARLSVKDRNDRAAIHLAVKNNNIVAIKTLVLAGADINLPGYLEFTPLQSASLYGNTSCVVELIKLGADINCENSNEQNALMLAAFNGKTDCLQLLIDAGADLGLQIKDDRGGLFGKTALMIAAEERQVNCLKLLLESGADVNVKTSDGKTALHYACIRPHGFKNTLSFECIRILLTFGANITTSDSKGKTALMYAARYNQLTHILPTLVESGAVVDQQDSIGMTALAHAVSTGSHKCVQWLVDHGASVNICDHSGKTMLHFLMFESDSDTLAKKCLEILLSKQPDVNATDKNGMTPLMCVARESGRTASIMAMLLKHGAQINLVDKQGQTALIYSLRLEFRQSYQIKDTTGIRFLLDNGANLTVGQIASGQLSRLAILNGDLDLVKLQVGSTVDLRAPWEHFLYFISKKKRRILQFLIVNGVVSSQPFPHRSAWSNLALTTKSLLEYAAVKCNLDLGMVKYFVATCYLRYEDNKFLCSEHAGDFSVLNEMNDLRSQPWPLVKLSFVAVSTAFGASPGRQERVKNSQLPVKLQNMLLFQEPWSRLCVHQWDKIPLTFSPNEYEKLPRSRPLLYHWPVGQALVLCDCGECDGTMYKYEGRGQGTQ